MTTGGVYIASEFAAHGGCYTIFFYGFYKRLNSCCVRFFKGIFFHFIYRDNISFLESVGCRIKYFSPLDDEKIPEDACGLILSGGYPELYADKLSKNKSMLSDIYKRINDGIPTIAECGGFMYLHRSIEDKSGNVFSMAGVLDARAYPLEIIKSEL